MLCITGHDNEYNSYMIKAGKACINTYSHLASACISCRGCTVRNKPYVKSALKKRVPLARDIRNTNIIRCTHTVFTCMFLIQVFIRSSYIICCCFFDEVCAVLWFTWKGVCYFNVGLYIPARVRPCVLSVLFTILFTQTVSVVAGMYL